jgi:hypothetical protein
MKRMEPMGVITLPISFGTLQNPRTEYITFDVVDMLYPYNAIFGRFLLNTFDVALHSGYLCLKIPDTFGIISIFESQKKRETLSKVSQLVKNVYISQELKQHQQSTYSKMEAQQSAKKPSKLMVNSKKVPLDPIVPNRTVCLRTETSPKE